MSIFLLKLGLDQLTETQITAIKARIPKDMEFVHANDRETVEKLSPKIEMIAGWFNPSSLLNMPNLKWAHFWGVGTDWLQKYPEMVDMPFVLTNVAGHSRAQINEHIFGMLLSLGRHLNNAVLAQQAGVWARTYSPPETEKFKDTPFAHSSCDMFELSDKTMLILGLGGIGSRTAKLAKAFDMHTIGVRRNVTKSADYVDQLVPTDQLNSVLPAADVVVITLPYTQETYHMFNAETLALMKPSAILINIGRGEIIDESALITALQNKTIRAAALDVFEQEPLPADSPLWKLDNVLITSHYGGSSPRYHERASQIFIDNLERLRDDRPLNNLVDKKIGY